MQSLKQKLYETYSQHFAITDQQIDNKKEDQIEEYRLDTNQQWRSDRNLFLVIFSPIVIMFIIMTVVIAVANPGMFKKYPFSVEVVKSTDLGKSLKANFGTENSAKIEHQLGIGKGVWAQSVVDGTVSTFQLIVRYFTALYVVACGGKLLNAMILPHGSAGPSPVAFFAAGAGVAAVNWFSYSIKT